jgi:hypothetical protein
MKRFILSASLVLVGLSAIAPAVSAMQLSTPQEVSDMATIHDLVQHNRDMRSHK